MSSERLSEKKKRLESLEIGKGIDYLISAASEILGNPIVLFDTSYNLLAHTKDVVTDDILWNELLELGTFSPETVDFFNTENFVTAFAESEIVAPMHSDKLKYDRANGKLFDKDNVQLGDICVVACFKPFEEGDYELIEILCGILSVELQNSGFYTKIDRVYQEHFINDLIVGSINDNSMTKAAYAELYEGLKTYLYIAIVDTTQYEQTDSLLAYYRDLFKELQPEYKYYIHLNNIVIIISTDNQMLNIEKDLKELNEFFIKYGIFAGISSRFQNLRNLQKYYREAINALNYGLDGTRNQNIFKYNNYRVEHFLNSIKDSVDVNNAINPIVSYIQEYDSENNTSLLSTLYYYMLYGRDLELTCEAIELSPEDLSKELKELETLFEIDWKNGDMLVNIYISIKMLDIFKD